MNTQPGCLYTKTGTDETFCFKVMEEDSVPDPDTRSPVSEVPPSPACLATYFDTTSLSPEQTAGLCCRAEVSFFYACFLTVPALASSPPQTIGCSSLSFFVCCFPE